MDPVLGTVTFVALTLAVGMSWLAARLLRTDRQRRAARIAALEAAAWDTGNTAGSVNDDGVRAPMWMDTAEHEDLALDPRAPPPHEHEQDEVAFASPMFAAIEAPQAPSRRWPALAAAVVVMAGVGAALYITLRPAPVGASASPAIPGASARDTAAATEAAPATARLELLSLKHTLAGDAFTVTGLIQNPRGGAPLASVTAVVYVFDATGVFSASARAPIEFRGVRPGEESPFVVRVPHTGAVTRYRVGFRTDDGRVIAHVDHRGQPPAGTTEGR